MCIEVKKVLKSSDNNYYCKKNQIGQEQVRPVTAVVFPLQNHKKKTNLKKTKMKLQYSLFQSVILTVRNKFSYFFIDTKYTRKSTFY